MTRAIGYVRLSAWRGEGDPSTSPERQRAAIEGYCAAKDWQLRDTVEDLDVSGSDKGMRLDRPGLAEIRAALPHVDVVIFAKLDRLARNVADFTAFAEEAAAHGVALVSVAESLDLTTPSGRFVATILAAFAEMEAATIAERTRAGRAAAKAQGRWTGGTPPYGTRAVPKLGGGMQLEPDPAEAETIRNMLHHVSQGWSLGRIARHLDHTGQHTRNGGRWWPAAVHSTIEAARRRGALTPTEARIWAERPTSGGERRTRAARLLSGLLVCSGCGGTLLVGSGAGAAVTYRCLTNRANRGECSRPVSVVAAKIEAYAEKVWLSTFADMPETRTVRAADVTDEQLAEVAERLAATRTLLAAASRSERARLVAELDALEDRQDMLRAAPVSALSVVQDTGRTLGEAWAAESVEGRRELVAGLLGRARLLPVGGGARVPIEDRVVWLA